MENITVLGKVIHSYGNYGSAEGENQLYTGCGGIAGYLKSGQIVNVDCTTIFNGYYGDASRMYCIGEVSEAAEKLVRVTKECLDLGLQEVKPWGFLGDVGYVINKHAKDNGYSVVREIGGHGIGEDFHEEPWVSHIGERGHESTFFLSWHFS